MTNESVRSEDEQEQAITTVMEMGFKLCFENICQAKDGLNTLVWVDFDEDFQYDIRYTRNEEEGTFSDMVTLHGEKGNYRIVLEFTDGRQCIIDDNTSCEIDGEHSATHIYYKEDRLLSVGSIE